MKNATLELQELDRYGVLELRSVLGCSLQSNNDVAVVVMALCLKVEELQREVKQLRHGLAQVVQMPLEK